jgi:nicotinate-nucleotide adenylyltransferase
MLKQGIIGGNFDPIHFGHLRMALELLETLSLDVVRFIPSHLPAHRKPSIASNEQRVEMLNLALNDHANFIIDTRELQRANTSYMIDTLTSLKQESPQDCFFLLLGTDAFLQFDTWHKYQEILSISHLAIASRPQVSETLNPQLKTLIQTHETKKPPNSGSGKIYFHNNTELNISSTNIRQQINRQQSPEFLLPKNVYHYIKQEELYE